MFIYVIGSKTSSRLKIGYTKNLSKRLSVIQTGNPESLSVLYSVEVSDLKTARFIEKKIHNELRLNWCKGEWFDIPLDDAIGLLDWVMIRYHD